VSTTSKTITVIPATGSVCFYQTSNHGVITVTINGVSKNITVYYSLGISDCSAAGCAVFSLPPGSYNFTATNGSKSWSGTVVLGINTCSTVNFN
jgi:hypothetical protein